MRGLIITNWSLEAVCGLRWSVRETLTLGTLRSLAPARAAARPEKGRSSVGENSPAGSGGAGGGGGAPGGRAGPGGGGGVPFGVRVGGSGGGGGGGGCPTGVVGVMAGVAVAEVTVEPGGRGGGGGGVGAVITGLCTMSDGGIISGGWVRRQRSKENYFQTFQFVLYYKHQHTRRLLLGL